MTRSGKPLRLALIGWGAINRRVAELLAERSNGGIAIVAVAVRNPAAAGDIPAGAKLITTPGELAGLDLDLIVEAAGREAVGIWGRPRSIMRRPSPSPRPAPSATTPCLLA